MARQARIVVPGRTHLVTQRGDVGRPVFAVEADYAAYLALLAAGCRAADVAVWGYVLLPGHVHLMLVPATPDGLQRALGEAHRRHARQVNAREGAAREGGPREPRRGALWQGRFASVLLDDAHLCACARYVELAPVRAGLAARPEDWRWSSVHAHLNDADDAVVSAQPLLARAPDWPSLLAEDLSDADLNAIHAAERSGRPLGALEAAA